MLVEIRIHKLAVIDDERIPFHAGLNVVTGETGVGKSLLFDSLSFLFGDRPRSRSLSIRAGSPRGGVEGAFELEGETRSRVEALLDAATGEGHLPDGLLVIQRDVDGTGRTRQRVNHAAVTASLLKELRGPLLEVHGQSEQMDLLAADAARRTLDEIAGLDRRVEAFGERYGRLLEIRREAEAADTVIRQRRERLEFLRFQAGEIALVDPKAGEHEKLRERRTRLRHAEKIRSALAAACGALADEEGAATERLHAAIAAVRGVMPLISGSELPSVEADLVASAAALSESARVLARLAESVESEPGEIEALEERFESLERLFRRHGPSEADCLEKRAAIDAEIAALEAGAGATRDELLARASALEAELRSEAKEISRARSSAASRLRKDVERELADLGMKGARFVPRVEPREGLSPSGADAVEFFFGANPGEPERPLHEAASGGELSRVMLALKSCLAARERVPLLVFDEIDSNVGGRLGDVLGRKLVALAAGRQVLVATHLPQVAAFADSHVRVAKEVRDGKTFARFEALDAERRVLEIAEMIRGAGRTDVTLAEAGEMISAARSRGGARR